MVVLSTQGPHAQSVTQNTLKMGKEGVILKIATTGLMGNALCARMGTEKKAKNVLN